MLVKFRVNLGTIDAKRLGIDHKPCVVGAEVDVPESAAADLLKSGTAEEAERSVRGVAKKPEVTAPAK